MASNEGFGLPERLFGVPIVVDESAKPLKPVKFGTLQDLCDSWEEMMRKAALHKYGPREPIAPDRQRGHWISEAKPTKGQDHDYESL